MGAAGVFSGMVLGWEVTTGEGVRVTSGALSRTSGQRQSQSEPGMPSRVHVFHMCSSCSFQWISFRWIHPAPSIRYSTLITRGKKCQRKRAAISRRFVNIMVSIVTAYNVPRKRWLMNRQAIPAAELIYEALWQTE